MMTVRQHRQCRFRGRRLWENFQDAEKLKGLGIDSTWQADFIEQPESGLTSDSLILDDIATSHVTHRRASR
jgi:hypothetical protein